MSKIEVLLSKLEQLDQINQMIPYLQHLLRNKVHCEQVEKYLQLTSPLVFLLDKYVNNPTCNDNIEKLQQFINSHDFSKIPHALSTLQDIFLNISKNDILLRNFPKNSLNELLSEQAWDLQLRPLQIASQDQYDAAWDKFVSNSLTYKRDQIKLVNVKAVSELLNKLNGLHNIVNIFEVQVSMSLAETQILQSTFAGAKATLSARIFEKIIEKTNLSPPVRKALNILTSAGHLGYMAYDRTIGIFPFNVCSQYILQKFGFTQRQARQAGTIITITGIEALELYQDPSCSKLVSTLGSFLGSSIGVMGTDMLIDQVD